MGRGKSARKHLIYNFENFSILLLWKDFVYIMTKHFQFHMDIDTASSARVFSSGNETFVAYEPHGGKEKNICAADRKKAIRALINLGLL